MFKKFLEVLFDDGLLDYLSSFTNILILIFVISILANFNMLRNIVKRNKRDGWIKIFWQFLHKPAWEYFLHYSDMNHDGTYIQSFDEYKRLHKKVRVFAGGTVGFVLIKIIFIIFAAFVSANLILFK